MVTQLCLTVGKQPVQCIHSRRTKKGISKRCLSRVSSLDSTESQTRKRSGRHHERLVPRLWVNKRGWHSNNIESCFNKLKRWGTETMQLSAESCEFTTLFEAISCSETRWIPGHNGPFELKLSRTLSNQRVTLTFESCIAGELQPKTIHNHSIRWNFWHCTGLFFWSFWSSDNKFDPLKIASDKLDPKWIPNGPKMNPK